MFELLVLIRNQSSQVNAFPAIKHASKSSLPKRPTVPIRKSYMFYKKVFFLIREIKNEAFN
jgi:hypothetical protein